MILLVVVIDFLCMQAKSQRCEADAFLDDYNMNFASELFRKYSAMFNKTIDITLETTKIESEANDVFRTKMEKIRRRARSFNTTTCSPDTKRQLSLLLRNKESANLTIAKMTDDFKSDIASIYTATQNQFPPYHHTFGFSEAEELQYTWLYWRRTVTKRLKGKYTEFVKLNNIGARENGFQDAGAFHRSFYDVEDLQGIAETFLNQLNDSYLELHGYVRYKLKDLYPGHVPPNGPIPAHLVDTIFGSSWGSLYPYLVPYPDEHSLDISKNLQERHSINGLLKLAEKFFTSLGWNALPAPFWERSVFKSIKGRSVDCYPKALDLRKKTNGIPDVRIVQCLDSKRQSDFVILHHEMGHIYYFLHYAHQPLQYRHGANPGFHEAVGDFVSLSVQTPHYLHALGLLDQVSQTKEADINFLLKMALAQIAYIPYAYIIDLWSWNVYRGNIKPYEYNKVWWKYRKKFQGISDPGMNKSEDGDFDPGAIYHISTDSPYINYFFSVILMFTFHKRSCELSNNTNPLHQCSIYNSKIVGKQFADMLKKGRSCPWKEILQEFTGKSGISVEPVKEYFKPLVCWLKKYRKVKGYALGWNEDTSDGGLLACGNELLNYLSVIIVLACNKLLL